MNQSSTNTLSLTTPSDREIVMSRAFSAPARLVYAAFTTPEHLKQWMGLETAEIDLRVGGSWRYTFKTPYGGEMGMHGEYSEIEPERRFKRSENFDEPFFEPMGGGTENTVTFDEQGGSTTMATTILFKSKEKRDAMLQMPMKEGAGAAFDKLEELLKSMS